MSALQQEILLVPLPDLPGIVHGLVSLDPPRVQCDRCGLVVTGDDLAMTVLFGGIRFDFRDGYTRRLCDDCRTTELRVRS
jgi:hypothetical protein